MSLSQQQPTSYKHNLLDRRAPQINSNLRDWGYFPRHLVACLEAFSLELISAACTPDLMYGLNKGPDIQSPSCCQHTRSHLMVTHIPPSFSSGVTWPIKISLLFLLIKIKEEKSLLEQWVSPLPHHQYPYKGGSLARGNMHSPKAALISGWRNNHFTGSIPIASSSLSPKAAVPGPSVQHYTGCGLIPGDQGLVAPFTLSLFHPPPAQALIGNCVKLPNTTIAWSPTRTLSFSQRGKS